MHSVAQHSEQLKAIRHSFESHSMAAMLSSLEQNTRKCMPLHPCIHGNLIWHGPALSFAVARTLLRDQTCSWGISSAAEPDMC